MSLIKSISGIRGTIGGAYGDGLGALDIVKFTTAYATLISRRNDGRRGKIVVGRDARVTGAMMRDLVCGTLTAMGYDVIDLGLATTPTTEIAVTHHHADGVGQERFDALLELAEQMGDAVDERVVNAHGNHHGAAGYAGDDVGNADDDAAQNLIDQLHMLFLS